MTDLKIKDNNYSVTLKLSQFLKKCSINKIVREHKLSNSRIKQITCTLYLFKIIVEDNEIQNTISKKLKKLFRKRIISSKKYYNNNELLKSTYEYFLKIIDNYFK